MNHSLLKHYAYAYFSLGKEKDKVESFKNDLDFIFNVFNSETKTIKVLSSPMIEKEKKDSLLDILKDKIDISTYGFIQVLIKKNVIFYFEEIYKDFLHLYNEHIGIMEGRIYTPFPLSVESMTRLKKIFSKKYEKEVTFKVIMDKNVIGGMRIYIDDTLYDYSLDSKLDQIRNKLVVSE